MGYFPTLGNGPAQNSANILPARSTSGSKDPFENPTLRTSKQSEDSLLCLLSHFSLFFLEVSVSGRTLILRC
jgi:hypothetical protein